MDRTKRNLKGSASRDAFKHLHKQPPFHKKWYAGDIDFYFVDKKQGGRIITIVDYKTPRDSITFAEAIAYNDLVGRGLKVHIITAPYRPKKGPFCPCCGCQLATHPEPTFLSFTDYTVQQYLGGNWKPDPPRVELETILKRAPINELIKWEKHIRAT